MAGETMALPTFTTVLRQVPRAIRQGTITSPSVTVPQNAADKFLVLVSDMDVTTAQDPNTIVRAYYEFFDVNSNDWYFGGGSDPNVPESGYHGGVHINKFGQQTQVFIGTGLGSMVGKEVRFVFDVPNAIVSGAIMGFTQ